MVPALAERVRAMPALRYEELRVTGGRTLSARSAVTLDRALLEGAEDGLSVEDCGKVILAGDVPAQLIRERVVSIRDCGKVICTAEQRPAVEECCSDVGQIVSGGEGPRPADEEGVVRINGAFCTL